MTFGSLAIAGLRYYRRTHGAVILGIATAVAVLAGSLLVGASVRESLRELAAGRLGRATTVVAAETPFTLDLSERLSARLSAPAAPMLSLTGVARHESSARRAGNVLVYGIDDRFFTFHGVEAPAPAGGDALVSPALARELGASPGDAFVIRLARPTDIPLDSLHGRREEAGRAIRLTLKDVLPRERMGEFKLAPGQEAVRAVFVPLSRLQRDLELRGRVNTVLLATDAAAGDVRATLRSVTEPADVGIRTDVGPSGKDLIIESAAGLISDEFARGITTTARNARRGVTPILTWLANAVRIADRDVPYSLITAIGPDSGDPDLDRLLATGGERPPIVLNEWAARDLRASAGNDVELEYYRWLDEGRLVSERASFRVAGIVPMAGLAVDRRLAPDYPGITTAGDLGDWDPPFPIDLKRVRPQDEQYWDSYRTAPKAFIPLAAGQALWRSRYGALTSIRIEGAESIPLPDNLGAAIEVVDVRRQNLAASQGATDFGAYFSYFSFFLMVSALLLAALFFRLSVEQRLPQIGVLRASGFSVSAVRRVFLLEGGAVAVAGTIVGILFAIAWAGLMMFALGTVWRGAVGTTDLELHIDPLSLLLGAIGAAVASWASIALTIRTLSRSSPRSQISGALPSASLKSARGSRVLAPLAALAAVALAVASSFGRIPAAGGFFGAGALIVVAGLLALRGWLVGRSRERPLTFSTFAFRNASWRPGRSLTAAGLVAAAVFLLISVDSFRKTVGAADALDSGTGGYALLAESEVPLVHDLRSEAGRAAAGWPPDLPSGVTIDSFRLRPGDDASCLNLYQPKRPRMLGVPDDVVSARRFRFARIIEGAAGESLANPWTLLRSRTGDGPVPAIIDQTSLQYVLHAAVGDTITIDADTSRPIDLRIVASLDDSMLQGEILIAESEFRRLFHDLEGYRVFAVDARQASELSVDDLSRRLEEALEPFGFDAESAVARLEAFHQVENTYLSTFQALGGLGLVLGCVGLGAVVARNIFERRRELALLAAAGFTGARLRQLVAIEHIALVGIGLAIGVVASAVAIGPIIVARSGAAPWHALIWILPILAAGALAAYLAAFGLKRLPISASLRSE